MIPFVFVLIYEARGNFLRQQQKTNPHEIFASILCTIECNHWRGGRNPTTGVQEGPETTRAPPGHNQDVRYSRGQSSKSSKVPENIIYPFSQLSSSLRICFSLFQDVTLMPARNSHCSFQRVLKFTFFLMGHFIEYYKRMMSVFHGTSFTGSL